MRVPGVGSAGLFGGLDYSMRVWLDLDRMSSLGITSQDVVKAIEAKNMQAAVGRVGAAPLLPGVDFQLNISAKGRLTSAEEFADIAVRSGEKGGLLRIRDIGRVELRDGERLRRSLHKELGGALEVDLRSLRPAARLRIPGHWPHAVARVDAGVREDGLNEVIAGIALRKDVAGRRDYIPLPQLMRGYGSGDGQEGCQRASISRRRLRGGATRPITG